MLEIFITNPYTLRTLTGQCTLPPYGIMIVSGDVDAHLSIRPLSTTDSEEHLNA